MLRQLWSGQQKRQILKKQENIEKMIEYIYKDFQKYLSNYQFHQKSEIAEFRKFMGQHKTQKRKNKMLESAHE